jgi:formylmethanofuran--tetrahydromethanopterin N-formyltransferase
MNIDGVVIEDTYAEAFSMYASRLVITAASRRWARTAAESLTGFATSVIGCGCEAGIEAGELAETPDGRPGVAVLIFGMSRRALEQQLVSRVGQSVMTAPTTACFDGLPGAGERLAVGAKLRFFGDGFQISKRLDAALFATDGRGHRRFWRIPVMDGEFVVDDRVGVQKGVGGGNFLIVAEGVEAGLAAAERASDAIRRTPGVIAPFPGGVVRSGSKVGSRYKFLTASTNSAYCPTLRRLVPTALEAGDGAVFEVVIDGVNAEAVEAAMRAGIRAAIGPGVRRISAGNYGGKLGAFTFPLRPLFAETRTPEAGEHHTPAADEKRTAAEKHTPAENHTAAAEASKGPRP